jgi:hypothetical protein
VGRNAWITILIPAITNLAIQAIGDEHVGIQSQVEGGD